MLLWILMESGTMSDSSASIKELQESLLPQTPAYWVFLPGLAVSAYVLWMGPRGNNRELFGPALLVFVLALAGPLFRALQQRVLASVCALLVISSYWTVPFLFLFVYSVLGAGLFLDFLTSATGIRHCGHNFPCPEARGHVGYRQHVGFRHGRCRVPVRDDRSIDVAAREKQGFNVGEGAGPNSTRTRHPRNR